MRREAPHVVAWVERMNMPADQHGEWLADDEVPDSLTAIFKRMFAEHWAGADRNGEQAGTVGPGKRGYGYTAPNWQASIFDW